MEQQRRNIEFVKENLTTILAEWELTEDMLESLYNDDNNPYGKFNESLNLMETLEMIESMDSKKMFILMQYTKARKSTEYLAYWFKNWKYKKICKLLLKYNKSESFADYCDPEILTMRVAVNVNSDTTNAYRMDSKPRGICIIFLNERKLEKQAQTFKKIFEILYFKVEYKKRKTVKDIREFSQEIANNEQFKSMNALITIYIGHGKNSCIKGWENKINKNDKMPMLDLVDIFSDLSCGTFKGKPKIHLFDCCQSRDDNSDIIINELIKNQLSERFNKTWKDKNKHSTIIFSCGEGLKSSYNVSLNGFTYYGRAFIYTLAQFADEHLNDIIKKVNQRLDDENRSDLYPYVIEKCCKKNIYFNPFRERIYNTRSSTLAEDIEPVLKRKR